MSLGDCDTLIQHELFSSLLPSRSQWNWTFMRPCSSVLTTSVVFATTVAVCHNKRINRHRVFAGLAARGKTRAKVSLSTTPGMPMSQDGPRPAKTLSLSLPGRT